MWYLLGAVIVLIALVLFARRTMNLLFYVQWLRFYWIFRDNGIIGTPYVVKAFMHQVSPPWWRGKGVQFRLKNYTLQVGILRAKAVPPSDSDLDSDLSGLLVQMGGRELDLDAKTIRKEWN